MKFWKQNFILESSRNMKLENGVIESALSFVSSLNNVATQKLLNYINLIKEFLVFRIKLVKLKMWQNTRKII